MTDATWYGNVFKTWQTKLLGPKPTDEQLANIHNLGARPGKQALAIAMGLRDDGVTGAQIQIACGAPQLNKMRGFITDALLKRLPATPGDNGHTVYKLAVTPKGNQRIERAVKAAAKQAEAEAAEPAEKPVKAKAAKKPAKAKKATADKLPTVNVTEADVAAQGEPVNEAVATELPVNQL